MQNKVVCAEAECKNKICKQPCDEVQYATPGGHFTHKPLPNSISKYLGPTDIQGNAAAQHYVPAQNPTQMTQDDLKNLTENDLQIDHKANKYCNSTQAILNNVTNDT